jgi:hypothetical protein
MSLQSTPTVPEDHILGVYNRAPLAFERGLGARLYTAEGDAYLDCLAGIATTGLGHCHPKVLAALKGQADKLWHVSNIFRIPGQEVLATRLCEFRYRGDRVRPEDRPQIPLGQRSARAHRHHRLRGRLPWAELRGSLRGRKSVLRRRLRAAPAGLCPPAVRRYGGAGGGHGPDHRGDHHRTCPR